MNHNEMQGTCLTRLWLWPCQHLPLTVGRPAMRSLVLAFTLTVQSLGLAGMALLLTSLQRNPFAVL